MKRPSHAIRARLREEAEEGDEVSAGILRDLAAYEATLPPHEVRFRDLADAGDVEAARIADELEAARRPRGPSADGGDGARHEAPWSPFRGPFANERISEQLRGGLQRKRFGQREAPGNRHPSLRPPEPGEPPRKPGR